MKIRAYHPSDRETLKEITAVCFGRNSSIDHNIERLLGRIAGKDWTWRKKRCIDDDIAANASGIFVAVQADVPVGYITTRLDCESGIGFIPNMAVLPDHAGCGLGRALIGAAVEYLRDQGMKLVRIETLESNAVGQHLYPSLGFQEVARQIHYVLPLTD